MTANDELETTEKLALGTDLCLLFFSWLTTPGRHDMSVPLIFLHKDFHVCIYSIIYVVSLELQTPASWYSGYVTRPLIATGYLLCAEAREWGGGREGGAGGELEIATRNGFPLVQTNSYVGRLPGRLITGCTAQWNSSDRLGETTKNVRNVHTRLPELERRLFLLR